MESPVNFTDASFPISCMRCNQALRDADRFCRYCGQDQLDAAFDPWASRPAALDAVYRTTAVATAEWTSTAPVASLSAANESSPIRIDTGPSWPDSTSAGAQWQREPRERSVDLPTRWSIGLMAIATLGLVAALTHDLYRTLQAEDAQRDRPKTLLQRMEGQAGSQDRVGSLNDRSTVGLVELDDPGLPPGHQRVGGVTQKTAAESGPVLAIEGARIPSASSAASAPDAADATGASNATGASSAAAEAPASALAFAMPVVPDPSPSTPARPPAAAGNPARGSADTLDRDRGDSRPVSCHEALAALALCPTP